MPIVYMLFISMVLCGAQGAMASSLARHISEDRAEHRGLASFLRTYNRDANDDYFRQAWADLLNDDSTRQAFADFLEERDLEKPKLSFSRESCGVTDETINDELRSIRRDWLSFPKRPACITRECDLSIEFDSNDISDVGVQKVCDFIKSTEDMKDNITFLNLGCNNISVKAFPVLKDLLDVCEKLRINLSLNSFTIEDFEGFFGKDNYHSRVDYHRN